MTYYRTLKENNIHLRVSERYNLWFYFWLVGQASGARRKVRLESLWNQLTLRGMDEARPERTTSRRKYIPKYVLILLMVQKSG